MGSVNEQGPRNELGEGGELNTSPTLEIILQLLLVPLFPVIRATVKM